MLTAVAWSIAVFASWSVTMHIAAVATCPFARRRPRRETRCADELGEHASIIPPCD